MLNEQAEGMASGVPTSQDHVMELMSMWVTPTARGQGAEDVLVGEIERWLGQSARESCASTWPRTTPRRLPYTGPWIQLRHRWAGHRDGGRDTTGARHEKGQHW